MYRTRINTDQGDFHGSEAAAGKALAESNWGVAVVRPER